MYVCFGSFQGVRHGLDNVLAEEARSDVDTRRDVPFPKLGGALGVVTYFHPPYLLPPSIHMLQLAQTVGTHLGGVVFVLHDDLESPFLERRDEAPGGNWLGPLHRGCKAGTPHDDDPWPTSTSSFELPEYRVVSTFA